LQQGKGGPEGPDHYLDADGLLYRKREPKLVIPENLTNRNIRDHHDPKYAAHPGVKNTKLFA
jgi:hypothetical protein